MTDEQLIASAITLAGGGLVAAFKWAVGRITTSMDRNTTAMLANTASNAILSTKVDYVARFVEGHTPVFGVPEMPIAPEQAKPNPAPHVAAPAPQAQPAVTRTPARGVRVDGGYSHSRGRTSGDDR